MLPQERRAASSGAWVREHEATLFAAVERQNPVRGVTQHKIDARRSAVADSQPDHFRRAPEKETSLREIRILRDDGEAVLECVLPNLDVSHPSEAAITKVQ